MELLLIPSLIAIGLKIAVFFRYSDSLRTENLNLGIFFLAIFLFNIAEFLAIKPEYSAQTALLILTAYYCFIVFIIHAYVNLAMEYAEFNWHASKIKLVMNLLLAFLVVNIIFNRGIIAGTETTAISLTKVPGDWYWIMQVYMLGGIAFGVGLLVHGLLRLTSNLSRQRCFIMLVSTLPAVAVAVTVVVMQAAGSQVTAAVVNALVFTLMLFMLVYAEEKTRLFRLLTIMPFTRERKLHKQLLQQITRCVSINDNPTQSSALNLKQMMRDLEGSVVEHVLGYYGGNQKMAANALGVSEATVSRRARSVIKKPEKQPV